MNNRILRVLALLAALSLALGMGAVLGGGIVYALTQIGGTTHLANAQASEPEGGIVIASVVPDGPAAQAGVVRGDILLEIDDETLDRPLDLARCLDGLEPGDKVELKVLHGDDERTLTATLDDRNGKPYLGLVPCDGLPEATTIHVGAPGAIIVEVMPDSPAEQAGLREGDVIVALDGQKPGAESALADIIADYEPGDTVTLEIERSGEETREVTVELGEHPEKEGVAYLGVRYLAFPLLRTLRGERLPFGELDEFEFEELPLVLPDADVEQGVIVLRVYEDSPASAAGLERGSVITAVDGEPVEGPQSLADAVAEHEPGDKITLTVYSPDEETEFEIEVTLGEHPDEEGKAYLGVSLGGFFQMQHFELEEGEQPPSLKFFIPPFDFDAPSGDWEFDFDFDLDVTPPRFKFPWPPGDSDEDLSGCLGESI